MILDLDTYRVNIPAVKAYCDKLTSEKRIEYLGRLTNATHCHIVVVGYYIAEIYGMTPELQDKINRDMLYHNVKGVKGYKPLAA